ncbi:MAG: class I SAM-dependent methyltransferase [Candidatus Latescibacteria bacterium]|nr:class I SAM-dependent methyltransferase [Candidatus Latescibacterota bacterium]
MKYLDDEEGRLVEGRQRFRRDLASWLPATGGRVLEIGCATGSLLAAIREAGHAVMGVDLSARFAEAARARYQVDVRFGDILSLALGASDFDLIVMLGTLANLPNLPAVFHRCHAMLKPAGVLVCNFPVADALVARLYRRRYWMFAPSVNTFLTQTGCVRALDHGGFRVERMATDRQMPTFRKLFHHARLESLVTLVESCGIGGKALPLPIPIPGVKLVHARSVS